MFSQGIEKVLLNMSRIFTFYYQITGVNLAAICILKCLYKPSHVRNSNACISLSSRYQVGLFINEQTEALCHEFHLTNLNFTSIHKLSSQTCLHKYLYRCGLTLLRSASLQQISAARQSGLADVPKQICDLMSVQPDRSCRFFFKKSVELGKCFSGY